MAVDNNFHTNQCSCLRCKEALEGGDGAATNGYVLGPSGAFTDQKWGPSTALGTTGGIVTWSLMDAGLDFGTTTPRSGSSNVVTESFSGLLSFDSEAQIRAAFQGWADAASIDIRIAIGQIDGASGSGYSTLGFA